MSKSQSRRTQCITYTPKITGSLPKHTLGNTQSDLKINGIKDSSNSAVANYVIKKLVSFYHVLKFQHY